MKHTFCPQCGWNVKVDEDLCCVECGATAAGEAVDRLCAELEMRKQQSEKYKEAFEDLWEQRREQRR